MTSHPNLARLPIVANLEQRQYKCTGRNRNQGETQLY